ncbi:hypothetical protein FHT70_006003 [Rhizobium sp. BK049]|uniref:hypothetical protein n=1 Tax=Rhizobium sp. BK049 TaxID=2587095 RepID=UPI001613CD2C|nr:hypothetical protein [Rhizobium sp. BK049]MBB3356030.1 hypothetical protein [Rhizobium sp. BK049]
MTHIFTWLTRLLTKERPAAPFSPDIEGMSRAMEIAIARFPHDPVVQESRAKSELLIRSLLRPRVYDA